MRKITAAWTALLVGAGGCVTVAEFRKLENEVVNQRRIVEGRDLADLRADLRALRKALQALEGRVEETERKAGEALQEARQARGEIVELGMLFAALPKVAPEGAALADDGELELADAAEGATAGELDRYREARSAARENRWTDCIGLFQDFLERFPTSPYADEAAFRLAECNYQRGSYREAILGFETVVSQYPQGERAADALYRQGEALLQLGPRYIKAARRAFERVLEEHPGTPRAEEAQQRLHLLAPP